MLGAIGQLLPVALAAAVSTVPITAMLLILLSPRRNAAALPFMIGTVLGMIVVVGFTTFLSQVLPHTRLHQPNTAAAVVEVLAGLALVVLGIRVWRGRHRPRPPETLPVWARAIDSLTGFRALGLGLLLDFRPKSLILAAVVGVQLHVADLQLVPSVSLALGYVVVATSTVTIPIVATLVAPKRMEPRLRSASELMTAEAPVISAVVMVMVGVVVAGAGLTNL
jgi:hypothetical protein